MTTRRLLVSVTALIILAMVTDQLIGTPAGASEPALMAAPASAAEQFVATKAAISSEEADLHAVRNELRFEQRQQLIGMMARNFRGALDDVTVVAD
ncbi:MAG: hypothetical protein AB8G17_02995 [Gammaproteobacteria bacterium]